MQEFRAMLPTVAKEVNAAISEAALNFGTVTPQHMAGAFQEFGKTMDVRFKSLETTIHNGLSPNSRTVTTTGLPTLGTMRIAPKNDGKYKLYSYNLPNDPQVRWWDVPKNFEFPGKVNLWNAFQFWMKGDPGRKTMIGRVLVPTPIRPFRLLTVDRIPTGEVRNQYKSSWRPILEMTTKDMAISGNENDDGFKECYKEG